MNPPRTINEFSIPHWSSDSIKSIHLQISRALSSLLPNSKQPKNFQWSEECLRVFEELKNYLSSAPLLNKLKSDEELHVYLVVSLVAISALLVREQD